MEGTKRKTGYYTLLWVIAIIFFLPVLWIILSAFKTKEDILAWPPKFFFIPTLQNFADLFQRDIFVNALLNSVLISLAAIAIAIVVAYLASFAFSRYKPKLTNFTMFMLLSIRMVPGAATVVPVFMMYMALGWKSTHWGMILFYAMFSIPFSVWIIKGFLDGVSTKFDETALVNGAGRCHTMFQVIMPQVKPGIVAAFIFNIIFVWNEFLFGFIIGGNNVQTMPVALATETFTSTGIDWPYVATMSVVNLVPLLIL
jgi:multiple sugar transport system permease protein